MNLAKNVSKSFKIINLLDILWVIFDNGGFNFRPGKALPEITYFLDDTEHSTDLAQLLIK